MTERRMQLVYWISMSKVIEAIQNERDRNHFGSLAFGDLKDAELVIESIRDLYGEEEYLHVSQVVNHIHELETGKMVGGANTALDAVVRSFRNNRVTR